MSLEQYKNFNQNRTIMGRIFDWLRMTKFEEMVQGYGHFCKERNIVVHDEEEIEFYVCEICFCIARKNIFFYFQVSDINVCKKQYDLTFFRNEEDAFPQILINVEYTDESSRGLTYGGSIFNYPSQCQTINGMIHLLHPIIYEFVVDKYFSDHESPWGHGFDQSDLQKIETASGLHIDAVLQL